MRDEVGAAPATVVETYRPSLPVVYKLSASRAESYTAKAQGGKKHWEEGTKFK